MDTSEYKEGAHVGQEKSTASGKFSKRQRATPVVIQSDGLYTIATLCEQLGLSPATVRDWAALDAGGLYPLEIPGTVKWFYLGCDVLTFFSGRQRNTSKIEPPLPPPKTPRKRK